MRISRHRRSQGVHLSARAARGRRKTLGSNLQGKVVRAPPQAEKESNFEDIFAGRGRFGGWERLIEQL